LLSIVNGPGPFQPQIAWASWVVDLMSENVGMSNSSFLVTELKVHVPGLSWAARYASSIGSVVRM
jgi:hypothetical protein